MQNSIRIQYANLDSCAYMSSSCSILFRLATILI